MKANELMIGDLVIIEGYSRICAITEVGVYFVDRNGIGTTSFDRIEPIPLTAEILEKNGFVEEKYGWRKLNAANWCININIFNGKERYALSVLGINSQVTLHGYYVHELQHALRLCGIDKEIVL